MSRSFVWSLLMLASSGAPGSEPAAPAAARQYTFT
jgi:hypothetical protein